MRRASATIIILSVSPLVLPAHAATADQHQPSAKSTRDKKAQQKKTAASSLTGCVDEQDGRYVLIQDQSRSLIANLEADGFPAEGFAKHLGHKVTVRGTFNPGGPSGPVFKVRSVETVSDACGPQLH